MYFSRNPSDSFNLLDLPGRIKCIFHDFDILANIGNFNRPFFGHNHFILSLTDLCLCIGKKIFKGNT